MRDPVEDWKTLDIAKLPSFASYFSTGERHGTSDVVVRGAIRFIAAVVSCLRFREF